MVGQEIKKFEWNTKREKVKTKDDTKLDEVTFGTSDCVWKFSIYLTKNDQIKRCIFKANQTKVKYLVSHHITSFSNPENSIRRGKK